MTISEFVNTIDNMGSRQAAFEQFVWELRRAFRDLAAVADREHERLGIQAGDRALLEFLAREQQPVSLSTLARKYSVSRQHIQQTLRRLPRPEWIEEVQDPADRRLVLLRLSRSGRAFWQKVRAVDEELLNRFSRQFPEDQISAATELLRKLRRELAPKEGGPE